MKKTVTLDDYRHKLVGKVVKAESYEHIKRYMLTAIRSLRKHEINGHLIARFIDKSINQLHGLSLLETDVKTNLNLKYAKLQLEIIKRRTETENANYV